MTMFLTAGKKSQLFELAIFRVFVHLFSGMGNFGKDYNCDFVMTKSINLPVHLQQHMHPKGSK